MTTEKLEKRKQIMGTCIMLILIAILEYVFFKKVFFNDVLIGEQNDSRLNNLIVEHWFKAFCGKESFSMVNIFYPMNNTLAYTDMLLGFSIPYSILRTFGVNMYIANKIVLIGFHLLGSYSLFYLLRKKFKVSNVWSFVGVVVFSYSSAYYIRIGHTQLMAISLIPVFIIMVYSFFEYYSDNKRRQIFAILTITIYVLMMYTSWYTAFFTALFSLTLIIVYFIVSYSNKNHPFKEVIYYIKNKYKEIVVYAIYGILIVIPFFMMYIPISRMYGKRTYGEITKQLPELIDFFNVSTGNRMLGWVFQRLELDNRYATKGMFTWELNIGFSIIVLALLVLLFFYTRRKYLKLKYTGVASNELILRISFIYSVAVSFLLLLQSNGASLWFFVYKLVPGASAIRAVVRYNFFLTIPIAIIIAVGGHKICENINMKSLAKIIIPICLAAVIWYSNSNKEGIMANWNIKEEETILDAVAAPPEDCECMYIIDTNPSVSKYYGMSYSTTDYQLMSWKIANKYGIHTLNGYSGQFPNEWHLSNPTDINSNKNAKEWIESHSIDENIYYYDLASNAWGRYR